MSNNLDVLDKRHVSTDCEDKYACKIRRSEHNYRQVYEYDKKMKREIANCNERRRMQSINTGFETLKELLPMSIDGEKLSKASILQLTAKYIQTLLSRLSNLEKEIACYKKPAPTKDKSPSSKSPSSQSQEQTRKRRLHSCTADAITVDVTEFSEAYRDTCDLAAENLGIEATETCDKTPGSLEHLVAAIEQVEGERFYDRQQSPVVVKQLSQLNKSYHSSGNSAVMKPTISPYTEKIIRAVSQYPPLFDRTDSRSISQSTFGKISPDPNDDNNQAAVIDLHSVKSSIDVVINRNKTL